MIMKGVNQDLETDGHSLFDITILEFVLSDWGEPKQKPQETRYILVKICLG
jgi:hypothetical protein